MALSTVKDSNKKSPLTLPDEPYHPTNRFVFPKRTHSHIKPVKCTVHCNCFQSWPLLHYNESQGVVFCHACVKAFELDRMKASKMLQMYL